jgi:hypothetical protein
MVDEFSRSLGYLEQYSEIGGIERSQALPGRVDHAARLGPFVLRAGLRA